MHRNLKPTNVIIQKPEEENDVKYPKVHIIDWSLSEFVEVNRDYNVKVCSRPYKAPELLIGNQKYDCSLDIWSLGCIFGAMILRRDHLFLGKDSKDQLKKIVNFFGKTEFFEFLDSLGFQDQFKKDSFKGERKRTFDELLTDTNRQYVSKDSLDLLNKLLVFDQDKRITALEAMQHPYFDGVRSLFETV